MIRMNAGRRRPENRVPTPSSKQPSAQRQSYTAPIQGLVTNTPLAATGRQTALVSENFWPTSTGIEPRGGTEAKCKIAGAVKSLFEYPKGAKSTYFAADDSNVYAFSQSTSDKTTLTPSISGQSGANYSKLLMQTAGGSFLTLVNGEDHAQVYDGTSWQKITDSSTPLNITGVSTNRLSDVWNYRNRTFFVEKNTMSAWYLGVNSISGTATELPLSGVFKKGGALLFGATWSSDSGSGMDDRCVFATDRGEFAVYRGGNPGDVNDWFSDGVYDIGEPLDKNAKISVGGDLIVATKSGLIPLSSATYKDPSQLKLNAVSRAVSPDWASQVQLTGNATGWGLVKWASRNMALVNPPYEQSQNSCWAINLETGAWTKFVGWRVVSTAVLGDSLYYGDDKGNIFLCDTGGTDNGTPFECKICFAFDSLGSHGAFKTAHNIKGVWRHRLPFSVKHTVGKDYSPQFGTAPSAASVENASVGTWDISSWDEKFWALSVDEYKIKEIWESVSAQGEALAPQIQILSAQPQKLDCELISVDLIYSVGAVVV